MKNKNTFRRGSAIVALSFAAIAGTVGVASAQSTTPANTPAATPGAATVAKMNGGGFGVHGDTIAKALGITTAQLQTELASGKTVAQIATAKGVNLQTVIDAYVAEESAEHPEVAKADVVARVTASVNGVRPTGGGRGGKGGDTKASTTSSSTASTTSVSA
jgi:hypothetical protein